LSNFESELTCNILPDPQTISCVTQDDLYQEAVAVYGPALNRLAKAYEADPEKRRDLFQEIHLALWQSFKNFERRCSLRTWVYRVAHNTAASHVLQQRRARAQVLMTLQEIEDVAVAGDHEREANDRLALKHLLGLIQQLKAPDRQIMVLYLEGVDAISMAEITGISPAAVRVHIHRIKRILARRFHAGVFR
jgi:RNA polymerase sigma-70 factor (ECF subfamily)